MDTTKFITGTLAGTVVGMLASSLIFGFALSSYMASNAAVKSEPDMLWLLLGHLVFAGLLTYIFLHWASIKTAVSGAKAGALIGFLMCLSMDLVYFATSDMFTGGPIVALVDSVGTGVAWAVGGAAIGWVLGRSGTNTA